MASACSPTSAGGRSRTPSRTRRRRSPPSTSSTTCCASWPRRPLATGEYRDPEGTLRLIVPVIDWDGYVRLAFDEIRLASADSIQVHRRLQAALHDLMSVVPPDRLPALERQVGLLTASTQRQFEDDADADEASHPDPQGIGSADDLLVHAERDGQVVNSPGGWPARRRC